MAVALSDPRIVAGRRTAVAWGACGLTILAGTALVLKGPVDGPALPLLGLFLVVPVWLATTSRQMLALGIVLAYFGLVDGFVKLKTGNEIVGLGRDVFLYAVLAGMAMRAKGPLRLPALGGWVLAWTVVILAQLASPHNGSLAHTLISLRQHLEFVPLFFVGYVVLRTPGSLHALFAALLVVASINGAVSVYQSTLTPAGLATWGPGYAALVTGDSPRIAERPDGTSRVRPPGLGSDMGFAGILGATALPGGIALLLAFRGRKWPLVMISAGMLGALTAVFTSQSRSAMITAVVAVLAMFGLLALGGQAKRSLLGVFVGAAIVGIAVLAIGSYDSTTFSRYSSITPNKVTSTAVNSRQGTWAAIPEYMRKIPFGAGLGTVGPAAGVFDNRKSAWNAESQFTFLVVEAGIPGLLMFLAFQGALGWAILSGLSRATDPRTVVLMAGVTAPLFGFAVNWLVGINSSSIPNAPYLWLAAGIVSWWLVAHREPGARDAAAV